MALFSESSIWKEIDLSESYLVCCMFEEAASLASSVIQRIRTSTLTEAIDNIQLADMMESAGMVFVQSIKSLERTRDLFVELEMLFGSLAAVPVQVFLTGACMQISEGYSSNLRAIFEEFLGSWMYLDGEVYVLLKEELQSSSSKGFIWQPIMLVEKYLEVAEVYAITLLGMVLHKPEVAISWTERSELPEGKRQDMLRRLHSLHLAKDSPSSLLSETVHTADRICERSRGDGDELKSSTSELDDSLSIEPISNRIDMFFWWFRTVRLKFGNAQLVLPRGRTMLLGSLLAFTIYILRNRSAALKRFAAKRASSVLKALSDAWQLAFSVQVNPLAAVQQLPSSATASRGSR